MAGLWVGTGHISKPVPLWVNFQNSSIALIFWFSQCFHLIF